MAKKKTEQAEESQVKNSRSDRKKSRRRSKQEDQKVKSWAREWGDAILFAGIAALIIRQFFFGAYRIPTPSMEKSLLVGDFLIVSKINYGPRTPMTIAFPFTQIHIPHLELPWFRIPGFEDPERYDAVVFNYPVDDAVVSQKQHYIKRLIGMPGDTLSMRGKVVYIDGERQKEIEEIQYFHEVVVADRYRLSDIKVSDLGGRILSMVDQNTYIVNMTSSIADEMKTWNGVQEIRKSTYNQEYRDRTRNQFMFQQGFDGNRDYFNPFVVPFQGQEITLNASNWTYYYDIIARYEENEFRRVGDRFIINGEQTNRYTIRKNYYFMMGDNRDNSLDSRFWGFVPDDHVEGKAFMIYFSWDGEDFLPRFDRLLNLIH